MGLGPIIIVLHHVGSEVYRLDECQRSDLGQ